MERRNFIEFVCGMRGSGKSTLCARHGSRFPRRILLDPLGEFLGVYPKAREASTLAQTLDALDDASSERTWIVVACIDPEVMPKLCAALAPIGSVAGGYSRAVGGVVVECGEIDTVAPNSQAIAPEVRNLFQRGRHYRVSVICATQRPRDVHRVATSQADSVCVFRQHEPRDVDYIAQLTSEKLASRVTSLPQFTHLQYLPGFGVARLVDRDGKVTAQLDPYTGDECSLSQKRR